MTIFSSVFDIKTVYVEKLPFKIAVIKQLKICTIWLRMTPVARLTGM